MSIAKIEDIAFVRFNAPDLAEMCSFIEDFGFSSLLHDGKLYGRGADGSPYLHVTEPGSPGFAGVGFRVSSRAELEALAERDAVPVVNSSAPGGGAVVRLHDPDGNSVDVVGEQEFAPAKLLPPALVNSPGERRRLRSSVRISAGASSVYRLGHVVLNVRDFAVSEAWYKERFGLLTSDQVENEEGKPYGAFLRCDRGDIPTDHHTLFLLQSSEQLGLNHAAFEVVGFDDLMRGHSYLKARNRQHAWGVGRHLLGSAIFDYWQDPWGNVVEHWTDGDLFISADQPNVVGDKELIGTLWMT
ncbi:glyoxalase [Sphingomonas sp. Root710]|uniref:VOC family protein n=1 Tax=Sphingomonas sp. Root710 TaxID=1736594 RepID=UPI0006FE0024|nr:VOC family protein [Sphingomonas sp. Root710]KRB86733.1 glyoxalase [Sphingomonas sp. Root710]